ncbi:MAG: DUF937 domain-containing protein [Bacteroidales bacterium]|nr:DUF937 domain-containing protein [Bacteroidales bacterium]
MDLNSIIGMLTAGNAVNDMGKQFNLSGNQVNSVITAALPTLIGAMQKNTATESGAASLANAFASHIGDSFNLSSASLTDGGKILNHILGKDSGNVFSALAKKTGTNTNQVSGILSAIAPMLLGLLGKGQKSSNIGVGGLGSLLGGLLGGGSSKPASSGGGLGSLLGGAMGDKNNNGIPDIIEGMVK